MSETKDKPLQILRAKNGGHIYHIVGKKRGQLLIKNPADDLLPVEMTQEQIGAIAVPAWEWDDELMNACLELKRMLVIHGLTEYPAYHGNEALIKVMRDERLKEKQDEHN
jgi:hypothetical protein